jgi:cullin 1
MQPPPALARVAARIEAVYVGEYPRRLLTWQFGIGTAQIVTRWTLRPYTLHVTTAQACALLLFNSSSASKITFDEICQALRVEAAFGKRLMHSLSCGRFRVLRKEPASQFVGLNDVFMVNEAFACESSSHIRMPTTTELETVEEQSKAQYIDHSATVQAAIVRVMKRERTLSQAQLVDIVMAELERFRVEPKKIRARIDHLVENEYLERGENDMYHFIP